jgi:N6-L-threonylcarbamoyladenine synthase
MLVLGIETSCDDTSVALVRGEGGTQQPTPPEVIAHLSFSQELLLRRWGGVVPEIAARNHLVKLPPLLQELFDSAKISPSDIDLIGVTVKPGLLGPLLTGLNIAKTLALYHELPLLGVNHLYAHLEAIHLTEPTSYPYLGVLVSGGHSLYALVSGSTDFRVIGTTIDDAAGEAFDKGGKLIGLGYPAGAMIDRLAKSGKPKAFDFPIGLKTSKDARLSFSGLKTSLRSLLEKRPELVFTGDYASAPEQATPELLDVCASYQHAIVEALALKLHFARERALELTGLESLPVVVGGGVACNQGLRTRLTENFDQVKFVAPRFCTDNGAMIAHYALRTSQYAAPFPECLKLDAQGRYLQQANDL